MCADANINVDLYKEMEPNVITSIYQLENVKFKEKTEL